MCIHEETSWRQLVLFGYIELLTEESALLQGDDIHNSVFRSFIGCSDFIQPREQLPRIPMFEDFLSA
jgi:hypothetical protein